MLSPVNKTTSGPECAAWILSRSVVFYLYHSAICFHSFTLTIIVF